VVTAGGKKGPERFDRGCRRTAQLGKRYLGPPNDGNEREEKRMKTALIKKKKCERKVHTGDCNVEVREVSSIFPPTPKRGGEKKTRRARKNF